MAVVNIAKLNLIRDAYPDVWEWMKHKSSWEHISLGAVLISYEDYIDEQITKEEPLRIVRGEPYERNSFLLRNSYV